MLGRPPLGGFQKGRAALAGLCGRCNSAMVVGVAAGVEPERREFMQVKRTIGSVVSMAWLSFRSLSDEDRVAESAGGDLITGFSGGLDRFVDTERRAWRRCDAEKARAS
jgi:hypothetical protein